MAKYTGVVISSEPTYINAETGEVITGITDELKLLGMINGKVLFTQLVTKHAVITGKTYAALNDAYYATCENLGRHDLEIYITKK